MSKTTETVREDRREFLKGLLLAGGALGAGARLEAAPREIASPAELQPKPTGRPGYRETEYVRRYYAKASL